MDENVKDKAIKSPKRVFWELMLIGVALFAAGIFTLANPQGTLKFVLIVLGVVSIVSSVGFFMRNTVLPSNRGMRRGRRHCIFETRSEDLIPSRHRQEFQF
jgi:hypothetical protein